MKNGFLAIALWMVSGLTTNLEAQQESASDWPRFLGPLGTGVSTETDINLDWPAEGLPVLWKAEVGTGYSAPSIRGDQVVLHHRIKNQEIIESFSAKSGQSIWRHAYPTRYRDPYGYNNGPRCTPLLTKTHCYTYGAEGKLTCLTLADGKQVWQRSVNDDFEIPKWFFGIGCTPVIEDDLLIALVGGQPNSAIVAFNKMTGKTVWTSVGKQTWDGEPTRWEDDPNYKWTGSEMTVSYSSPIVVTIHKQRHLLALTRQGLVSLDPQTGKERFRYWFRSPKYESVNAARPVVIGDQILLSSTYGAGAALLKVKPDSNSYDVLWSGDDRLSAHWSTPIVVDGYAYGFDGRHENEATLRCIDMKNGQVEWVTKGFDGELKDIAQDFQTGELIDRKTRKPIPFPFYGRGSKIQVGDHFIVLGERGTLALVEIDSTKWSEKSRFSVPEMSAPTWTAPVLSRRRLYLRDEDTLICLDVSSPASEEK